MTINPVALTIALLALAACGSGGGTSLTTTTTARPATPTPSPTAPEPTPTPTPDDERVVAVQTGLGVYLETTFAGAFLHNAAGGHAARGIAVHLDVTAGARHIGSADVRVDSVAPGATVPVGGRIQGSVVPGESVTATITVTSWDAGAGPPSPATPGSSSFACPRCHGGPGSGDVTFPLTLAATAPTGSPLAVTAICSDAGGRIVGGGAQLFVPPGGAGATVSADIPAVVSAAPSSCAVGVAPGGL